MNFFLLQTLIIFLILPPFSTSKKEPNSACSALFNCGNLTGINYPFWGGDRPEECGYPGLELDCDDNIIPTIDIKDQKFIVLGIDHRTRILKIARKDLTEDTCLDEFVNTTLDSTLFEYTPAHQNLTLLYGCPPLDLPVPELPGHFTCEIEGIGYRDGYAWPGARGPGTCNVSVVVPIQTDFLTGGGELPTGFDRMVKEGFEVRWKVDEEDCDRCMKTKGRCGFDLASHHFVCWCGNRPVGPEGCTVVSDHQERNPQEESPAVSPATSGTHMNSVS